MILMNNTYMNGNGQKGATLIVALVALIVLSVLGVAAMGDVLSQSAVVRNEQFRQKVYYAPISEFNSQIKIINSNAESELDPIIESLQGNSLNGRDMLLDIDDQTPEPIITQPQDAILNNVTLSGDRRRNVICPGESHGRVNVIVGRFRATATLDDGRCTAQEIQQGQCNASVISSEQEQRGVYCWAGSS